MCDEGIPYTSQCSPYLFTLVPILYNILSDKSISLHGKIILNQFPDRSEVVSGGICDVFYVIEFERHSRFSNVVAALPSLLYYFSTYRQQQRYLRDLYN